MTIWVDADSCPKLIKAILFRAAERTGVPLILVANQYLQVPSLRNIRALRVASGFDVADTEIVKRVARGDLVITSDIPLAAEVIEQGAFALTPRGEFFTRENVQARLDMRDFMDAMRASGVDTGGPSALSGNDRRKFANSLDRYLANC